MSFDPNAEIAIPFTSGGEQISVTLWKCVYNWFLDEFDPDPAHRMTDAVFAELKKKGAQDHG